MKTRIRILLIVTLLASLTPLAALASGWQHIGDVTGVKKLPNGLELKAGQASVRVLAVGESTIRVRLAPSGAFPADHSWAVLPESLSTVRVNVRNTRRTVEFSTPSLTVRIQKSPLLIVFLDPAGNVIVQDDP